MRAAGQRSREPQGCSVRGGYDLHVHPVTAVFHRVVRLVRRDAVADDQRAVEDDEPLRWWARAAPRAGSGLARRGRRPSGSRTGRRWRWRSPNPAATWARFRSCAAAPGKAGMPQAAQPAPSGVRLTPSGVDEPGNGLNGLERDVSTARYGTNRAAVSRRQQVKSPAETTRSPAASRPLAASRHHALTTG